VDIKLNCDIGEGYDEFDKEAFKYIDMANVSCGYHAGNIITTHYCILLSKKYKVKLGAHISYKDRINFGRKSIVYTQTELEAICHEQISKFTKSCNIFKTDFSYVKPHGAMYNDMMKDEQIFRIILKVISSNNANKIENKLKLVILSTANNYKYQQIASEYDIELIYEVFADRNYTKDGFLVPRDDENAVIKDKEALIKRIKTLKEGYIQTIDKTKLYIPADTICVHGDNLKALEFIKILRENL